MNGHTPGPWRVTGAYVIGDDGLIVRQAAAYDAAPNDLRLIAAAPSMYDFVWRAAEAGDGVAKTILEAIHGRA